MLSMVRWIHDRELDTDVAFFHCARTAKNLIFDDEAQAMAHTNVGSLPRFEAHVSLTRSRKQDKCQGLTGHLDAAMLQTVAPDFAEREVYICGPTGFMDGTRAGLQSAGFDMHHFHEESIGTAIDVQASGGSVRFEASGLEVECSGQPSILGVGRAVWRGNPQGLPHRRTVANARCALSPATPTRPTVPSGTRARRKTAWC